LFHRPSTHQHHRPVQWLWPPDGCLHSKLPATDMFRALRG
jgi:hypothetical protein